MKKIVKLAVVLIILMGLLLVAGCPNPNIPKVTIPAAPSAFISTVESDTSISLAWTDNANDETGFVVDWSKESNFATIEDTASPAANATTLVVTALDASTEYFFRVKAVNNAGSSTYAEVSATTDDPPITIPAAPSVLVLTAVSDTEINVAWTDNSNNETGFVLEWDTDFAFGSADNETPGTNVITASVTGLTVETEYFFRIKAVNSAGSSAWSTIESETTGPAPAGGTFIINGGATYTTSTSVTLNNAITDVVEMRFQNTGGTWSGWETYAATKSWTLPSGDGTKTVYAEFKNSIGIILAKSDTIILDITAPTGYVQINAGATYTSSTSVTLNSYVTGATQMRFATTVAGLSSATWSTYNSAVTFTLPGGDGSKYVYAEFKDAAGNIRSYYSDSIILDRIAPTLSYFYINSNATYSKSTSVTLYLGTASGGATSVRFYNSGQTPSAWQSVVSTKSWTLLSSDGTRGVYVQIRDGAGNVRTYYDSIILDRVAPVISSFIIWDGSTSTWAYSTSVNLKSTVTGSPTYMRFRNYPSTTWSSWSTYNSDHAWTLTGYSGTPTENAYEYIYMEVMDAAGNVRSAVDNIRYNAYTTLRFTATSIYVADDTEAGAGEMFWTFGGYSTSNTYFTIYTTNSSFTRSMDSGTTWNFPNVSKDVVMRNIPGEYYQIRFQLHESDSTSGDDHSSVATLAYYLTNSGTWATGSKQISASGAPAGTMYYTTSVAEF